MSAVRSGGATSAGEARWPIQQRTSQRRVEFADTDMAGIAHFARFFVFMETAEHELLRAVGAEVHTEVDGHPIGWPRVATECEYLQPARFGDMLTIRTRVARKGLKSLIFEHHFFLGEALIARGRMTSVCCRLDGREGPQAIPIPASIAEKLEEAPTPPPPTP